MRKLALILAIWLYVGLWLLAPSAVAILTCLILASLAILYERKLKVYISQLLRSERQ